MPKTAPLKQTQAREVILHQIRSGRFRPGQRLPSERQLAIDLSLSHITVRKGLEDLVDAGVIVKKPRVGNFVQEIRSTELAQRVAIVLPRVMHDSVHPHPVTAMLMKGILGEMDQRDYAMSLLSYDQDQFWMEAGESMLARDVKGALVYANADTPKEQMEKLASSGVKVVLLHGVGLWPELKFSSVSIDLISPMRQALEHLMALGHRRIVWASYDETRYRAIEDELVDEFARRYSLGDPQAIICRLSSELPYSYAKLADLFDRQPMPTAIVMQDEFMAHELFRFCHQRGVRVPDDLSLVAIADSAPQTHLVPLSAPNTGDLWVEAARKATAHLKYMMSTENPKQMDITLRASIQWKQSTAAPADVVRGN